MMKEKIDLLKELMKKIKAQHKEKNLEVWFYPEYEGVKGFLGTQDIILLGLNPSSGAFPSKNDKKLYSLLKEHGLENIHISDFFKVRTKNKDVRINILENKELIDKEVKFLKEELDIVKPRVILAMGHKCKELMAIYFPHLKDKTERMIHYSFRFRNKEEIFNEISDKLAEHRK